MDEDDDEDEVALEPLDKGALGETAFLGFARYVRLPGTSYETLQPRWRIIAPVMAACSILFYSAVATGQYCLSKYYYGCKETPYWEMFVYVIPNRIPFTNYVIIPDFINRYVLEYRGRQTKRMALMTARTPQSLSELFWSANAQPENIDMQFQAAYYFASPDWLNQVGDAFKVLDHTIPYILKERETMAFNLSRYTRLCFQYEQDAHIIETYKLITARNDVPPEAVSLIASAAAEAHYLLGDFEAAEQLLEKHQLLTTLQGILLKVRIHWENGEQGRARAILEKFLQDMRISRRREGMEKLLMQLAKFQYETHQNRDATNTLGEIIALSPDDPMPRVQQLGTLDGEAFKTQREDAIETYLMKFSTSEAAMLALGGYAAEKGNYALAARLEQFAIQGRFPRLASFRFLYIETLITAGHHAEALEHIAELFLRKPEWLRRNDSMQDQFECLRMLCSFAEKQPETARASLQRILRKNLPVAILVATARRLQALGYPVEARRVLLSAYIHNHHHQGVLLELVKTDLKNQTSSDALAEHLTHLLEGRRPPRYVLQDAYQHFGSDRFLYTAGRDALLEKMEHMLRTLHLPVSEVEKSWKIPAPAFDPIPLKRDV